MTWLPCWLYMHSMSSWLFSFFISIAYLSSLSTSIAFWMTLHPYLSRERSGTYYIIQLKRMSIFDCSPYSRIIWTTKLPNTSRIRLWLALSFDSNKSFSSWQISAKKAYLSSWEQLPFIYSWIYREHCWSLQRSLATPNISLKLIQISDPLEQLKHWLGFY